MSTTPGVTLAWKRATETQCLQCKGIGYLPAVDSFEEKTAMVCPACHGAKVAPCDMWTASLTSLFSYELHLDSEDQWEAHILFSNPVADCPEMDVVSVGHNLTSAKEVCQAHAESIQSAIESHLAP